VKVDQLVAAEHGWKAVFKEPDGAETVSRILGWAVADGGDELVGVIVDPGEPSRIIPAAGAASPGGGTFTRYRFVPPEPPPPPPPPAPAEAATQLAKGVLKRRR
jgi:hypothetical protein